MKTLRIDRSEILRPGFVVPPENGGQIVTVSYASTTDGIILKRVYDASDRTEEITAYDFPTRGEFEPWNGSPKLGRRLGGVILTGYEE